MKTDRVLTMSELLASWYIGPFSVTPPASDARHIPISAEAEAHRNEKARHCCCDRWGHQCEDCGRAHQQDSEEQHTISEKKH